MPALELARFTVKPGGEASMLADREAMLGALRGRFPGVRDAYLARLGADEWIDVVVWDSREQAERAAAEAFDHPDIAGWFRHIDRVVAMEHADVPALDQSGRRTRTRRRRRRRGDSGDSLRACPPPWTPRSPPRAPRSTMPSRSCATGAATTAR